ncbi:MAG TPA: hypothetical protein VD969_15980 [Symbiobacteriaceae bacterium]|nr:hypothetical protein [Symbiobacteriaceae bacterium]
MINLFRPVPAQQGSLTAALLALLEHSDRGLLNGLLKRAGIDLQAKPGSEVTVRFPVPGGPPGAGLITAPGLEIAVAAQQPGEAWDPAPLLTVPAVPLTISLAGTAPPGAHGLSWEQVDRWLAEAAARYDPESRTGFLIEQFRAVLPELGIAYFEGFEPDQLTAAPEAHATLNKFYETADRFFDQLAPALAAARPGAAQVRQARPEELLAGYCYRDYSDPALGATGFLRVALNLPEQQLQAVCWLMPGSAHSRLGDLLTGDPGVRGALARLEHHPLLWLWSPAEEKKLALDPLDPEQLEALDWSQFHAGVQVGLPFDQFPAEDLAGRVAALTEAVSAALAPAFSAVIH